MKRCPPSPLPAPACPDMAGRKAWQAGRLRRVNGKGNKRQVFRMLYFCQSYLIFKHLNKYDSKNRQDYEANRNTFAPFRRLFGQCPN